MSSSNSNIFKGPLFQPTNPESVEAEEGRSTKSQFKFPVTGRQAAMPMVPPEAGQQVLSQFNLPIASEPESSMFQFPDIEQQAAQSGLPVTSRHHIPLSQHPAIEEQSNSTHGPIYPVTNEHNIPPTANGHAVSPTTNRQG